MELIVDAAVSAVDGVTDTDTGGFVVRDTRAIGYLMYCSTPCSRTRKSDSQHPPMHLNTQY